MDHGGGKIVNLTLACALAAVGFLGAVLSRWQFLGVGVRWITVALIGVNGARAIFWTIPPRFLSGVAAAGGLAFINSIGTTGGTGRTDGDGVADGSDRLVHRRACWR